MINVNEGDHVTANVRGHDRPVSGQVEKVRPTWGRGRGVIVVRPDDPAQGCATDGRVSFHPAKIVEHRPGETAS